MATLETYQVIAQGGVVVEGDGNSVFYPAGAIFQADPNNASIQRHLASQAIVTSTGEGILPPVDAPVGGGVGPTGPQGAPGGPAGSLFSCKIRTTPFSYPLNLVDSGSVELISWPVGTEELYDEVNMFVQSADAQKVFVKAGGAGRYHAEGSVNFGVNPNGARFVEITQYTSLGVYKDSQAKSVQAVVGIDTILSVSGDFNAIADDYFMLSYRQTGTIALGGAAAFSAMLMGSGDEGSTGATGGTGSDGSDGINGVDGAVGPVGPEGPAGTTGTVWRGNWSSITSYVLNDAVSYLGSSFVAINPSLNDPPPSANWLVIAAQGSDGATGATGSAGDDGSAGTQGVQGITGPSGGPAGATGIQGIQGAQGGPGVTASAGASYLNFSPTPDQTIFTIPGPDYPLDTTKVEIHMRGSIYNTPEFFTVTGGSNQIITWLGAFLLGPNFPFKMKFYT